MLIHPLELKINDEKRLKYIYNILRIYFARGGISTPRRRSIANE